MKEEDTYEEEDTCRIHVAVIPHTCRHEEYNLYINTHTHTHTHTDTHTHVYVYESVSVSVYIHVYMYMYTNIYVMSVIFALRYDMTYI
jgi:hypothetical protein